MEKSPSRHTVAALRQKSKDLRALSLLVNQARTLQSQQKSLLKTLSKAIATNESQLKDIEHYIDVALSTLENVFAPKK